MFNEIEWLETLQESIMEMWQAALNFLPLLIWAIVLVLIGWFIGAILGRVVAQILKILKIDEYLKKAGVEDLLHRGGVSLNSGYFLGTIVKWFVIVAFLMEAFRILGLAEINEFLARVLLEFFPNLVVAVLILIAAALIGDVLKKIVSASAASAKLRSANLLGNITKWSVWIFAIFMALSQIGVGRDIIDSLITGVIVAIALAVGLSFGLGGQGTASRLLEKVESEISHRG